MCISYSGSLCQEVGSEESRGRFSEGEATDCSEGEITDSLIDSVASQSDDHWESESETSDDDSVYVPTPDRLRLGKASPIDLPNKLFFFTLPDLGKNNIRHCSTPGCKGNLVPISVKTKGLGGAISVSLCCDGCSMKGAMFETHVSQCENSNAISICVQVAFIIAGSTHAEYSCSVLQNTEECTWY